MAVTSTARLDRVEDEMSELKQGLADVRADVKGLGGILNRIEQSMLRAQDEESKREEGRRHSPVAIATVLITMMSVLIGGAWTIGSTTARTTVRLDDQDVQMSRIMQLRDRELDVMTHRLDRLEDREGQRGEPSK